MFEMITKADFAVLKFAESLHNPLLDMIMSAITFLGDGAYLWIGIAIILLFIPKQRKTGVTVLVGLIVFHVVCNTGLKNIIARPRPFTLMPELWNSIPAMVDIPKSFSMPSGHTMSSVLSAFLIGKNVDRLRIPTYVMAALIAFSRIYVLVHYPSDVIVGAVLGVILGIIIDKLFKLKKQTV